MNGRVNLLRKNAKKGEGVSQKRGREISVQTGMCPLNQLGEGDKKLEVDLHRATWDEGRRLTPFICLECRGCKWTTPKRLVIKTLGPKPKAYRATPYERRRYWVKGAVRETRKRDRGRREKTKGEIPVVGQELKQLTIANNLLKYPSQLKPVSVCRVVKWASLRFKS